MDKGLLNFQIMLSTLDRSSEITSKALDNLLGLMVENLLVIGSKT